MGIVVNNAGDRVHVIKDAFGIVPAAEWNPGLLPDEEASMIQSACRDLAYVYNMSPEEVRERLSHTFPMIRREEYDRTYPS